MSPGSRHSLERTAHHEAGHAAAAWLQEVRLVKVSIRPVGMSLGRVVHASVLGGLEGDLSTAEVARLKAERLIRICQGGRIAEQLRFGRADRLAADLDRRQVVDLMLRLAPSPEEMRLWWRLLELQTRRLLGRPVTRAAVGALAAALLERTELNGDEAELVLEEANAAAPPHQQNALRALGPSF